jgi:hypothetical protein
MPSKLLQELKKWLKGDTERRVKPRRAASSITVFYFEGGAPLPHHLRDISISGLYLYTEQRWYPGTLVRLALQVSVGHDGAPNVNAVMLWARAVRHGVDGVGLEFVNMTPKEKDELRLLLEQAAVGLTRGKSESGQSLIELSLLIPFLFLWIINAVNFGALIFAWITIADAARAGVQYGALSATTYAQISTVVTDTTASLKNKASITVVYSRNANGTITCPGQGSCAATPPADPEPAAYTLACVDVTYTYVPIIPVFSFPSLGISLTLPPTTVHRRAVMRLIT